MATMIKFRPDEEVFETIETKYGILLDDDTCICGCCGSLYEKDEFFILEELSWLDIEEAIKG